MYSAAFAAHAKCPLSGEMGLCAAAGLHDRSQHLAQSPLYHRRIEGNATPPGKAPGH